MKKIIAATLCMAAISAFANEQTRILAATGDWAALAHSVDLVSPPDVCLLGHRSSGLAFRHDANGTEARMINKSWSLPAGIEGTITIAAGTWNKTIPIRANTDTAVAAIVDDDDLSPMFAAIDRAATMTIKVGKAKPVVISLAGSTKATNAFRTCAGIKSTTRLPGGNPFE